MWSVPSSVARIENFKRQRRQRRQKPGDLLIEQVCRPGYLRPSSVREGRNYHFFSPLPAQRHVPGRLLFGECGVRPVLRREKEFRGRQYLGRSQCSGGLLNGAVAL